MKNSGGARKAARFLVQHRQTSVTGIAECPPPFWSKCCSALRSAPAREIMESTA